MEGDSTSVIQQLLARPPQRRTLGKIHIFPLQPGRPLTPTCPWETWAGPAGTGTPPSESRPAVTRGGQGWAQTGPRPTYGPCVMKAKSPSLSEPPRPHL